VVFGRTYSATLFHGWLSLAMTALVVVVGALTIYLWQRYGGQDPWPTPAREIEPPVDHLYDLGVVRPIRVLARAVVAGDSDVIEAYVGGAGAGARGLGRVIRLAQNGNVQTYLMVVVVGAAAVALVAGVLS
jgi:NADH-quinone oxidoreductase subunit L